MSKHMSVPKAREILGMSASEMSDEEIEGLVNDLERVADVLFDCMVLEGRIGLEGARWDTHFRLTGEAE